jgi:hypothetical protein
MPLHSGREDSEDYPMMQIAMAREEDLTTLVIGPIIVLMIVESAEITTPLVEVLCVVSRSAKIRSMSTIRSVNHHPLTAMQHPEWLSEECCRTIKE